MWEALLSFFSNLILFTAGLILLLVWIVIIILICVEIYDLFAEHVLGKKPADINEEEL